MFRRSYSYGADLCRRPGQVDSGSEMSLTVGKRSTVTRPLNTVVFK